jgi:hypothetical protein
MVQIREEPAPWIHVLFVAALWLQLGLGGGSSAQAADADPDEKDDEEATPHAVRQDQIHEIK